jgi:hypothetical protein
VASVGMETNQAMNTERFWIGFEVAACRRRARQNEMMVRAWSVFRIRAAWYLFDSHNTKM